MIKIKGCENKNAPKVFTLELEPQSDGSVRLLCEAPSTLHENSTYRWRLGDFSEIDGRLRFTEFEGLSPSHFIFGHKTCI